MHEERVQTFVIQLLFLGSRFNGIPIWQLDSGPYGNLGGGRKFKEGGRWNVIRFLEFLLRDTRFLRLYEKTVGHPLNQTKIHNSSSEHKNDD